MIRMPILASLIILSIWGSACTKPEIPAPQSAPKVAPEMDVKPESVRADLQRIKKAKLEVARYELQLYEEQLEVTKKEISNLQQKAGTVTKNGAVLLAAYKELLAKRNNLEEKVIQAKVKLREVEILTNEKQ
jgi:hypothetical protein